MIWSPSLPRLEAWLTACSDSLAVVAFRAAVFPVLGFAALPTPEAATALVMRILSDLGRRSFGRLVARAR